MPTPTQEDKVVRGQKWQPPKALIHNAWTQTAIDFAATPKPEVDGEVDGFSYQNALYLKVKIGSAKNVFDVVGYESSTDVTNLTEALRTRFGSLIVAESTPVAGRWAVIQKQTDVADQIVPCVTTGNTWVQANITDVAHGFVDISGGALTSQADAGLGKILTNPSGATGMQWVFIEMCCSGGGDACAQLMALPSYNPAVAQTLTHAAGGTCEWTDDLSNVDTDAVQCDAFGDGTGPAAYDVQLSSINLPAAVAGSADWNTAKAWLEGNLVKMIWRSNCVWNETGVVPTTQMAWSLSVNAFNGELLLNLTNQAPANLDPVVNYTVTIAGFTDTTTHNVVLDTGVGDLANASVVPANA